MRSRSVGVVAALLLAASACGGGGDDAAESTPEVDAVEAADESTGSDGDSDDSAPDAPDGAAATVTIGSDIRTIDGDVACLTGAMTSFTFANGSDEISITDTGDLVLVRMTIDGNDWVDAGSAPSPEVTGEGAGAVVAWSGEMSSNGVSESVSLEVTC